MFALFWFALPLLFFILLIVFPMNRETPFALPAQARSERMRQRFAWHVGVLRCFNPESLSVRTLSSKQPVNILCFITMTLICLVKLNHIFHMVQVHSTELTRIPQALLSTGEIRIT